MLSVRHRFHGYNGLRGVYGRGQSLRSPMMNLRFIRRGANRPYRVAVVVSRRVSKSAVVRNRIRRRVYETVRRAEGQIKPGTDMVFTIFDAKVAEIPAEKLQATIENLLAKVPGDAAKA